MAHIMVVDDEGDSREFVSRFLARTGHRVSGAKDGQEALHKLLHERPDVVVLDVRMPTMDGVGLLEIMRSYLRWHHVPVIVLSAHATQEQLDKMQGMGVRHVLHKAHFTLDDLGAAIDDELAARNADPAR
jgi:two-component system response regulator AtoC